MCAQPPAGGDRADRRRIGREDDPAIDIEYVNPFDVGVTLSRAGDDRLSRRDGVEFQPENESRFKRTPDILKDHRGALLDRSGQQGLPLEIVQEHDEPEHQSEHRDDDGDNLRGQPHPQRAPFTARRSPAALLIRQDFRAAMR